MIKKFFSGIIVVILSALILVIVVRCSASPAHRTFYTKSKPITITIPEQTDWRNVDEEIIHAVQKAHKNAEQYAGKALSDWTDTLMIRVDKQFLPWYFSYVNQTKLQLLYAYYWGANKVVEGSLSANEKINLKIQNAFATKVLRPEISELEVQNISQDAVDIFVKSLHEDLRNIKENYSISDVDWQLYIQNISSLADKTEGQRSVPLLLKATMAAGVFTSAKIAAPTITLVTKTFAKKLGPKLATGSAGKFASLAGKSLGTYVAVGLVIWEAIDHLHTKNVNAPILRGTIADYLVQVEIQLKQKIMATITEIESDLVSSVESRSGNP